MSQKTYSTIVWTGVIGSISLSIYVWGDRINWAVGSISGYQWFPLFGLIAWTVMCQHYYSGFLRLTYPNLVKPRGFSKVTGAIVLGSLLAHPGILTIQQYKNGLGLPPDSYVSFVGEGLRVAVLTGTVSLVIFLSFELFNRLKDKRVIKKYWPAISVSQSIAMTLIFVHSLRLGSDLGDSWFRVIWIFYGLALLPSFYVIHKADFTNR